MKYTLLDLTQTILSSMDSDEINSIGDSVESQQVAKIIRTVYFDIINRANLPEHFSPITLDASGNSTKPVLMTVPDTVSKIIWLKYDNATVADPEINMQLVTFLSPENFLDRMDGLNETDTEVDTFTHTVGTNSYRILYKTDRAPATYTALDDRTLIFNSYDSSVDTTLQKSKTRAYAKLIVPFTMADTFTPDLDEPQFALLLNEAKALAWAELKQAPHAKAEQSARRGWTNLQTGKYGAGRQSDFDRLPNFGRLK